MSPRVRGRSGRPACGVQPGHVVRVVPDVAGQQPDPVDDLGHGPLGVAGRRERVHRPRPERGHVPQRADGLAPGGVGVRQAQQRRPASRPPGPRPARPTWPGRATSRPAARVAGRARGPPRQLGGERHDHAAADRQGAPGRRSSVSKASAQARAIAPRLPARWCRHSTAGAGRRRGVGGGHRRGCRPRPAPRTPRRGAGTG